MSVEWVGVGLTVFGIGIPSAVGIMKLLPQRESKAQEDCVKTAFCNIRHQSVDAQFGAANERLDNAFADLNRRMVRVEDKIDRLLERDATYRKSSTKVEEA